MGEEEGTERAENHQEATKPDNVDTWVLGNLKAGELRLFKAEQGKAENTATLDVKLRIILPDDKG